MNTSLEMFGHLVVDRAASCLAARPHDLPALFEKFRADFAGDAARLDVVASIEEMAASFTGRTKAKRARRKSLRAILRQASKAGNVTSVTVDGVEHKLGDQTTPTNPWDQVLRHDTH